MKKVIICLVCCILLGFSTESSAMALQSGSGVKTVNPQGGESGLQQVGGLDQNNTTLPGSAGNGQSLSSPASNLNTEPDTSTRQFLANESDATPVSSSSSQLVPIVFLASLGLSVVLALVIAVSRFRSRQLLEPVEYNQ